MLTKLWKNSTLVPIVLVFSGPGQGQSPLTIDQALQVSQAQSIEYQRSHVAEDLAGADQRVLAYENSFRLSLGAVVSDYRPKTGDGGSTSGTGKDRAATLTLSKTIYDFGRHGAKMTQAELLSSIKTLSTEDLTDVLRGRVARAFGLVVAAQRATVVTANQLRVSESRLTEQTKNYRGGLRSESDFIAAQVDLGKARLSRKKSEDDLHLARLALAALMGDPAAVALTADLVFTPDIQGYTGHAEKLVMGWGSFQQTAAQRRREKEKAALTIDRDLVSLSKRPYLAANVAAQKAGPWGAELKDLYTAQLAFSWDIPWNGMGREELNRIAFRAKDLELQGQLEDKSRKDRAEAARQNVDAAIQQLRASFAQEKLTTRLVSLVRQRYQSGKATSFEVSAAETENLNTQLDQSRLLNSLINAMLDLASARGIIDIGAVFPGGV